MQGLIWTNHRSSD